MQDLQVSLTTPNENYGKIGKMSAPCKITTVAS